MDICIFFLLLLPSLFQALPYSLSATSDNHILEQGSSLSVEKQNDVLVSPNGVFSAGFSPVGDNAFCFSIRFMKSSVPTIVWMANRNQPVNGKASKLSLLRNGNLILLDAGRIPLWSTETTSPIFVYLQLHDSGNLVLHNIKNESLWESFDSPTDTLLPGQKITKDASLLSSKSQTNYSSGYYTLYFDNDNVIRLLFQGPDPEISSVYWPEPNVRPFEAGRTTYNNSKTAMFNSTGYFQSSDDLVFSASDCGMVLHRRLTVDPDGNLRFYSFDEKNMEWVVTWQAFPQPCRIHGICGPNSLCKYDHALGRRCSCLPGFKMKSNLDWSYGCEPVGFNYNSLVNNSQESGFVHLASTEFYGYDKDFIQNTTLQKCKEKCLSSQCKAIQFKYSADDGYYNCYTKPQLLNGHQPYFQGDIYVRMPKSVLSSIKKSMKELWLNCPQDSNALLLNRTYEKEGQNRLLKFVLWFAVSLGGVEFICISLVFCFLFWNSSEDLDKDTQEYMLAATTRFQKFSYDELKKATRGFHEEIGRGAGGIVYKGILPDDRVAAIKRLINDGHGGEAHEFHTEVSTIGRLNHMNLIEMWGYCAEGKHRILVYEYMENGSLASKLSNSNALDWEKRFGIALGTAKGLAYLHEECLEWVLHCDVKPQNILLDSNYRPKVADFGLSKLQDRGMPNNSSFSSIRGTRGYMAPEWVYNLPITSKVDVYSYGIVALEIVTGKKPAGSQFSESGMMTENHGRLVKWVKEKMIGADTSQTDWTEEVADSTMSGKFDKAKLEVLVKVALQCVEEDKEARPTMRQVVEMLQGYEEEKIFDTPKVPDASCESELPYFDNIGKFTDEENNSRTFLMGH
ncbi:putative receptor protein kinase ZmPK1 [Ziziphus jujuba]|uniref:Receptor-like serine/threonine-protein kinase n=1 Tax=Ziziphus jujuba TaxID=326968 RepID=A0A6P3YVI9_ZIZJJ|nr:putative receptor protein kinase ZmPK1 [Ziziphus jujuba]